MPPSRFKAPTSGLTQDLPARSDSQTSEAPPQAPVEGSGLKPLQDSDGRLCTSTPEHRHRSQGLRAVATSAPGLSQDVRPRASPRPSSFGNCKTPGSGQPFLWGRRYARGDGVARGRRLLSTVHGSDKVRVAGTPSGEGGGGRVDPPDAASLPASGKRRRCLPGDTGKGCHREP